jgi:hypothetical protein
MDINEPLESTGTDESDSSTKSVDSTKAAAPLEKPNATQGGSKSQEKLADLKEDIPPYVRFYSDQLKFLWEQYIKLIQMGILASALTIGFLTQFFLGNENIGKAIKAVCKGQLVGTTKACSVPTFVGAALCLAALAALTFVLSRWCSQILMERQVYASPQYARAYFELTKSIIPTAIQAKAYTPKFIAGSDDAEKNKLVDLAGSWNEAFKFIGIASVIAAWAFGFAAGWPLVQQLSAP